MDHILNYNPSEEEKLEVIELQQEIYETAIKYMNESFKENDYGKIYDKRVKACELLNKLVCSVELTEYLLLDAKPRIEKRIYKGSFFNLGTMLKMLVEEQVHQKSIELNKNNSNRKNNIQLKLLTSEELLFNKSLQCFISILKFDFENEDAIKQITSIYTQLTFFVQGDSKMCLNYLQQALLFAPDNSIIHYNLAYIYQRLNNLELALIHYKISNKLNETSFEEDKTRIFINNFNGIASVYRSVKQWPESLHFLLKAKDLMPLDPDINNQLGVVYTEMRRTDLAEDCYKTAIEHYTKTFVSTDATFLLSEIYLNYGHLHSYNGNNTKSIECYNKSLNVCPLFTLPFQNKIMNLNYIFDQLPDHDKLYIAKQHQLINKLYQPLKRENPHNYVFDEQYWRKSSKINVGIISGDFVDHPVSFFISTFLKNYDNDRFNVVCYSECIIDTHLFNNNLKFQLIKNKSAKEVSELVYNDNITILLDLAGHTAFNRLDVFSLKPSPIQVTYIGYPFSTGLNEMDYRITDSICDGDLSVSQEYYTEKLLILKNCFLCYDPTVIKRYGPQTPFVYPTLNEAPFVRNKFLTIGCYNRVNKISDSVIDQFNKVLLNNIDIRFIFKTKALINKNIQYTFLSKFDELVRDRITILDCTLSHEEHLDTYNLVDIAIDTFPYSGTTTSCEALFMGVPVLSMYDSKFHFHPQNVTCSILKNSNMEEYIFNSTDELLNKINKLKLIETWGTFKQDTRNKFLDGYVCNKEEYMKNIQQLFVDLHKKHSPL